MNRPDYFRSYYERNKEKIKARAAEYRRNNPDKAREAVRRWLADPANAERVREYHRERGKRRYWENRDAYLAKQAEYRARKPEVSKARNERWRASNPSKAAEKTRRYNARRRQRIPSWQSADDCWLIAEIYDLARERSRLTGVAHHVDHVIPLFGRAVSGLHTPWNLRVIPGRENVRKGTSFTAQEIYLGRV